MSVCPRCTLAAPEGARFCPGCGARLGAPEPARFASPDAYTPPHLAQRILDARAALEGERKQVTVLFADIHGFVDVLGDRDPEEVGPILDRVRELMMEAVHRYEGTVNQVVGDGIMALFGAPLANEDHAVRACYAALRMQAQAAALGDEVLRSLGLPLQIRVGLNSGEVVVRSIGSDLSFTYTAVGQTVHLAARMEQMAKPASILATEHTVALARGRVSARPLGPVPVRGLQAPVEVHEINGAVPIRSRLDAASAGRPRSPLVGRQLARVLSFESNVHWEMGASDDAARVGARALAIAEQTQDMGLQVVGNYNVGAGRRALGDYRQALVVLRRNLALLPPYASGESFGLPGIAAVLTRSHLAWTLAELGQFEEALGAAEDGVRLAEARRDTYSLTYALLGLGGTLVRRGQMWEARSVLERGIALCADMPAFYPPFAGDLAIVYALTGRMGEALELAERGVRQAQSMQRLGRLSLIVTHLGEVRLLAGQTVAAEAEGRRALGLAEAHKERGNMVYARRLLGLAAAEGSPPDAVRARGHYLDALALAEELGMRPLVARGHLGLGRLARRAGDAAEAERHLATARALFQEMRMTFWLERMGVDQVSPGRPEI